MILKLVIFRDIVLAIETSCDETSASMVVRASNDNHPQILSLKTYSQIVTHQQYGGVVPELAAREHLFKIKSIVQEAVKDSGYALEEITSIAVTCKPGLIGGLLVGVVYAKTLAMLLDVPLIGVDHLEGHIFTTYLSHNLQSNFYVLLVSGGHTKMMYVESFGKYWQFGQTLDDSLGECFDKIGKMMGLSYPAGPMIEQLAKLGNQNAFIFDVPMKGKDSYNFSFSGLKTFFLRQYQYIITHQSTTSANKLAKLEHLIRSTQDIKIKQALFNIAHIADETEIKASKAEIDINVVCDICASLQNIVANIIIDRVKNMLQASQSLHKTKFFVLCGGVAANQYIRDRLTKMLSEYDIEGIFPPINLATDNAAMIGAAGLLAMDNGMISASTLVPESRSKL